MRPVARSAGCQLERLVGRADLRHSRPGCNCLWNLSVFRQGCQCRLGQGAQGRGEEEKALFGGAWSRDGVAQVPRAQIPAASPGQAQREAAVALNGCAAGHLRQPARSTRAGRERTAQNRCCASCLQRRLDRGRRRCLAWLGRHPGRECRAARDRAARAIGGRW